MLVLSRRLQEKVMIGHDIELVIVEIKSGVVRLGFHAPHGLPIHREEVYDKVFPNGKPNGKPKGKA